MESSLQGLVFDFDGTLFESEIIHYESYCEILQKHFKIDFSLAEYQTQYLGFEDKIFFETYLNKIGIPAGADLVQRLTLEKAQVFSGNAHKVKACPDSAEFVHQHSKNYKMAICSGAYKSDILAVLNASPANQKLKMLFEHIVCTDDVTKPKPWPEGYILACKKLSLAPHQCVAFEDSPTGLEAATKAGLKTVALTHSRPKEILNPLCKNVFDSFNQINLKQINF